MFDRYERLASGAVDLVFGERVRIEPMINGDLKKGGPDPDRQPVEITAVIDINPELATVKEGNNRASSVPQAVNRVDVSFVSSLLPYAPTAGDRVVALARSGAVFLVSVPERDGGGRTVLRCRPGKA
jgi:hypothetical protein